MSNRLKEGNRRLWWKPGSTSGLYRQKVGKSKASYWNRWQNLPLTSIGTESGPRNGWKPKNWMAQEIGNRSWWLSPINHQCKPGRAQFRLKIAFIWCLFETVCIVKPSRRTGSRDSCLSKRPAAGRGVVSPPSPCHQRESILKRCEKHWPAYRESSAWALLLTSGFLFQKLSD